MICWIKVLDYSDICRTGAFLSLLDVKRNLVTVIEGFESGCIDCRVVDEHISAVFMLDESKSFLVAKPFNSSISHVNILLS